MSTPTVGDLLSELLAQLCRLLRFVAARRTQTSKGPFSVFKRIWYRTLPPSHAEMYARVIPEARVHLLSGRDPQLNNDLSDVAKAISTNSARPVIHM